MNLRISLIFLLFSLNLVTSQTDSTEVNGHLPKFLYDETRQRLGDVSLSYQSPKTTGNNFMGNGLDGNSGYSLGLRFFIYKQFFVGYRYGENNFDVILPSSIGNINSVKGSESFLNVGYEFLPLNNMRLGLNVAVIGSANFYNDLDKDKTVIDTGSLSSYGFFLSYEISDQLSIFAEYANRFSKTDIEVPSQLESVFRRGTYNTVNIGLRFSFGNYDAYDHLYL